MQDHSFYELPEEQGIVLDKLRDEFAVSVPPSEKEVFAPGRRAARPEAFALFAGCRARWPNSASGITHRVLQYGIANYVVDYDA